MTIRIFSRPSMAGRQGSQGFRDTDHGVRTRQDRKAAEKADAWERTAELRGVKQQQASRSKEGRGEE